MNRLKDMMTCILYHIMPRIKIDYSNTMFYKIVCKDLDIKDFYVGHTTDFKTRKNCHKRVVIILMIEITIYQYISL